MNLPVKPYLIIASDFVKTGGMDRANFALADYLARKGETLHLVAHRVVDELSKFSNVKIHKVPLILDSRFLGEPFINRKGYQIAQELSAQGARVVVNGGNCQWGDINWVHYVHKSHQPVSQVGLLRKLKTFIFHQIALREEQTSLAIANLIIANSHRTKQDLIQKLMIPPEKVHVVYYGNDPQEFYPASRQDKQKLRQQLGWPLDQDIIIFIGALGDRRKGFDTVLEAWQRLSQGPNWNAQLMVVGVGAELDKWRRRIKDEQIAGINFLGFRSDVPDLLRASDCLVSPTRYEAYGLGVHEALCCELPAIVTSSAGVAERYPPQLEDLLLPDPDDSFDLAERIAKWSGNKNIYQYQVSQFSKELRSYTWDDMGDIIFDLINKN